MPEQHRHASAAARGTCIVIFFILVLTLLVPSASGVWREETRLAVDPVGHSENDTAVLCLEYRGPETEA